MSYVWRARSSRMAGSGADSAGHLTPLAEQDEPGGIIDTPTGSNPDERSHRRASAQVVSGHGTFHDVGMIPKKAHGSWLGWRRVGIMTRVTTGSSLCIRSVIFTV